METKVTEKKVKQAKKTSSKKRNKTFIIVLALLVIFGAWFGLTKYVHGKHHEETDDAQVEANSSPVIPRISGYVLQVRIKDNQPVHKGDTLLVLDDRDLKLKLAQAEAALTIAQSNLEAAKATTSAANSNIATSKAAVSTAAFDVAIFEFAALVVASAASRLLCAIVSAASACASFNLRSLSSSTSNVSPL